MDPGETEVDALKRELVEEIGYQLSEIVEIGAAVEYINASTEIGITGYEAGFIKRSSMPKWKTESKRIIS